MQARNLREDLRGGRSALKPFEGNQEMSELREGDRVRLVTHQNWGVGTVHALFPGALRFAIVKFGTGTKTCWLFDLVKEEE